MRPLAVHISRKIVGWEVHEREGAELAAELVRQAVWAEGCLTRPLVLHADNGSPMKGATMKATLERLGVIASYQPVVEVVGQPKRSGSMLTATTAV